MSDQPNQPQPGPGQPRQLNLQQMANQFMAGLQRHFDMLAFNIAARDRVTEDIYEECAKAPALMPVAELHQNFEQMQAHARDLMLRQNLNDALNLAVNNLHNCHFFLALIKIRKAEGEVTAENQKAAQEAQQAFLKLPVDEKFNQLENDYGIVCEFEDSITGLGIALQSLVRHQGYPPSQSLDENGQLVIDLVVAKDELAPAQSLQPANYKVEPKRFGQGEKIHFSNSDLQSIFLTVGIFAQQLFTAVAAFARPDE